MNRSGAGRSVALAFVLAAGMGLAGTSAVRADELPGTGSLSGTVSAGQPFKAAKVYARDSRRHVTYMTYTREGRYNAINLVPGTYEVTVEKAGFATDPKQVVIEGGKKATADFALRAAPKSNAVASAGVGQRGVAPNAVPASYDEVYPPGPGRDLVEGTCVACHGMNWLPGRPNNEAGWNAALDTMQNLTAKAAFWGRDASPLLPEGTIDGPKRKVILDYLVRNFGPDKPVRTVRIDVDIPLDEAALSKALWIEYSVPEPKAANGKNRWIQETYFDPQGNLWLTERTNGAPGIVKLDPRAASFTSYSITNPKWSPHGIIVDPADGHVWWAGEGVYLSRLDPKTGKSKDYIPEYEGAYGGHTPAFDSQGNIWFTMLPDDRIGKWDRKTDTIKTWQSPTKGGRPYGMVIDHNDKMWYAQWLSCKVTRFDPVTEKFTEFTVPSAPCTIRRIGLDSRGKIWYGAFDRGKIGVIDPSNGSMKEYPIGRFAEPYDTWTDAEDNVWFGDGGRGGMLIKFDQKTQKLTHYPSPQPSDMPKLAITREGAIWYSNRSSASGGGFPATVGALHPDMSRMKTFGAFYAVANGKPVGTGSPRPASR